MLRGLSHGRAAWHLNNWKRNLLPKIDAFRSELQQERERSREAAARQQADEARRLEGAALRSGAEFAAGRLREAAGPELEARLVDLAVDELEALPPARLDALRETGAVGGRAVTVRTAYDMDAARQASLRAAVARIVGQGVEPAFERDASLLAGLSLAIGDQVLALNLRDELHGFAELAPADGDDGEPA